MRKPFFIILSIMFISSCYKHKCTPSFEITSLLNNINRDIYLSDNDTIQDNLIIYNLQKETNKMGFVTVHEQNKISSKIMYNNNRGTGSCFYYKSNGSMDIYNLRDFQGQVRYARQYKNDTVFKSEGSIIGQFMWDGWNKNKDGLSVKDTVVVHLAYAIPPYCVFYILIKDSMEGRSGNECDEYVPINGESGIATIKKKYNNIGRYTRTVFAILRDTLSLRTEYDTTMVQFNIR